jgi:hypothetical protein
MQTFKDIFKVEDYAADDLLLEVLRVNKTSEYTIGCLFINDKFFCNTLEDPIREIKVQDDTAIWAGTYKVILDLSDRFKRIMPHILDVSEFTGVRIHNGRTTKHTSGCILVGDYDERGTIINSKQRFEYLMKILRKAKNIDIKIM